MSTRKASFRPSARRPRVHFRKLAELDVRVRRNCYPYRLITQAQQLAVAA